MPIYLFGNSGKRKTVQELLTGEPDMVLRPGESITGKSVGSENSETPTLYQLTADEPGGVVGSVVLNQGTIQSARSHLAGLDEYGKITKRKLKSRLIEVDEENDVAKYAIAGSGPIRLSPEFKWPINIEGTDYDALAVPEVKKLSGRKE